MDDSIQKAALGKVHLSLALTAQRLGEAAADLASISVPMLGAPPLAAPALAMPVAEPLSAHAAPIALSAPAISRAAPMLAIPL
jgi:hypothetical protein